MSRDGAGARNSTRSRYTVIWTYLTCWTQLPRVANMPTAAVAIMAVASHPRMASRFVSANSPITALRDAISIIIAMIGTAATPLIMALQISAFTGSREVKLSAAPTTVAAAMCV